LLPLILFYLFATVLVLAALGVIISRNPVYAALSLVLCFFTSAVLWLLIEAEFLAIVLVLVYVGAVMVLFLFVIMMLDIKLEALRGGFTRYAWFAWIAAAVVMLEVAGVVLSKKLGIDVTRGAVPLPADYSNTRELGALLYSRYTYPLEIAAMLLLVAMVAAITLTLRHRAGLKKQDINKQVAARASERVRILKMDSESRQ
jgi:NADH-quinone oxidoreductase subunit J